MYGAHFARRPTAVAELLMCMLLRRGLFYRYVAPFTVKHSGKLNWTKLNWAVQFSSVSRCALNRPRSAMIRRRNWRSSQVLHNRDTLVNRPINAMSVIGRKPATTGDGRHIFVDGRRRFLTVKNLWRPSPVVAARRRFNGQWKTELNSTERSSSVQLSSVQFSVVHGL